MTTYLKKFGKMLAGASTVAAFAMVACLSVVMGCGGKSSSATSQAENTTVVMDLTSITSTTTRTTTTYTSVESPPESGNFVVSSTPSTSVVLDDPARTAEGTVDSPIVEASGKQAIIDGTAPGTTQRVTRYTVANPAGGDTAAFTINNRSNKRLTGITWVTKDATGASVTQFKAFVPTIGNGGKIAVLARLNRLGSVNAAVLVTAGINDSRGFTLSRSYVNVGSTGAAAVAVATSGGITVSENQIDFN